VTRGAGGAVGKRKNRWDKRSIEYTGREKRKEKKEKRREEKRREGSQKLTVSVGFRILLNCTCLLFCFLFFDFLFRFSLFF